MTLESLMVLVGYNSDVCGVLGIIDPLVFHPQLKFNIAREACDDMTDGIQRECRISSRAARL